MPVRQNLNMPIPAGSPATNRLAEMYNRRPAGLASLVAPPRTPIGGDEDRQRLMEMQRETYRNFLEPPGGTPIYDPMAPEANIYGGEGPIGRPLSPGGSGFLSGDPQPRRGDYDAETGAMEYMKAMRGWRNAQGIPQPGSDRTTQEQARIMMLSLGMRPPDTRSETGLASIPPSLLPNFSPNIGLGGTPISVAPNSGYQKGGAIQHFETGQQGRDISDRDIQRFETGQQGRDISDRDVSGRTDEKMSGFLRKYAITPHLMDVNFFNEPSFDKWVQATRAANQAGSPIPYVAPMLSDSIDALKVGYDAFINNLQNSQSFSETPKAAYANGGNEASGYQGGGRVGSLMPLKY